MELPSVLPKRIGYLNGANIVIHYAAIMLFELLNDLAVEYSFTKQAFALVGVIF